jgi:hypothetical protein
MLRIIEIKKNKVNFKRKISLFPLLFIVTILLQGWTTIKNTNFSDFEFIENSTDTSLLKFVKTYNCISVKGDDIQSLYRRIKVSAQKIGANCYKFKKFTRDSSGTMALTLDTYIGSEIILNVNSYNHEKNTVYIFCNDKFNGKIHTFKINKVKKTIKSGTCYKYSIKQGEKVIINKGGFFGSTVKIKWEEDSPCRYMTISGFGLSDTPYNYYNPSLSIGVSFTNGKIKYLDDEYGVLLAAILEKQK